MIPSLDLLLALTAVAILSAALLWAGLRLGRKAWWVGALAALVAAAVLVLHALVLVDNVELARLVPLANLIVWGNVALPAAGLLTGVAWARIDGPWPKKALLAVPLAAIGLWRGMENFVGAQPPVGPERWTRDVCRQTSLSSCSAAAAATALRACGISTTEAEMIPLCLTRVEGTPMLGLWRGLVLKTRGTGVRAVPFRGTIDDLRQAGGVAVVSVSASGLPRNWLGQRGRHSVVIFGFDPDGTARVGDPFVGRQRWPLWQLQAAWEGDGVILYKPPSSR